MTEILSARKIKMRIPLARDDFSTACGVADTARESRYAVRLLGQTWLSRKG
jgi:hypothetical protein